MENELRTALIQTDLVWEDAQSNRNMFEEHMKPLNGKVDLIILPEMFTTGFTMNPTSCAETMDGKSLKWLKQLAAQLNSAISGSLVIKESERFYNRLVFVQPDGTVTHYDKRHTFTLSGEDKAYCAGNKKIIITYKGWKICPLICYDLRFPVWSRNTEDYDLLIYVSNWPDKRILAWDTLLRARAIENLAYSIGVNRLGLDGEQIDYSGHSAVYDPLGNTLSYSEKKETLITTLAKSTLLEHRNKLRFLHDRDQFTVT